MELVDDVTLCFVPFQSHEQNTSHTANEMMAIAVVG